MKIPKLTFLHLIALFCIAAISSWGISTGRGDDGTPAFSEDSLIGSQLSVEKATDDSLVVAKAKLLDSGRRAPGSVGEGIASGVKLEILETLKGDLEGQIEATYRFVSWPPEHAQIHPQQNEIYFLFLERPDPSSGWTILKVCPPTEVQRQLITAALSTP